MVNTEEATGGGLCATLSGTAAVESATLVASNILAVGNSIPSGTGGGMYAGITTSQGALVGCSVVIANVTALYNNLTTPSSYYLTGGAGVFALLSAGNDNATDRFAFAHGMSD